MEYVPAKDTKEDFDGFVKLEAEFDSHYVTIGAGEQYTRIPFLEKPKGTDSKEFEYQLKKDGFFVFAKDGTEYAGYVFGYIKELDPSYKAGHVGILDSIIVAEKYRGKGISTKLRDLFFEWLHSKDIAFCQLEVKTQNTEALEIYKKWGFEIDELRMWKKF